MDSLFAVQHAYLIPLLPLIGALLAGFLGPRVLKGASHWPIWLGVGASAVLSLSMLCGAMALWRTPGHESVLWAKPATTHWFTWISAGDPTHAGGKFYLEAQAGAFIDPLSVVMLCVVTGIGFLITVFSAAYMKGDSGYSRFFAYLGLFIFSMTILVMANNFIMLYLGWEGVGLCSYLLIGHYYDKPSARDAAKKAFIVNRVGDFGFSLGIMLIFLAFGTVSFFGAGPNTMTGVLEKATIATSHMTPLQQAAMMWAPFLLMIGAFGKSAQFPLYVWLPDAMEGPTPVSALIHAATMVTAGVYMIARCGTLFVNNDCALATIAVVGAITALLAATIALRQFDLKKVFAYSTISQLGFMFVGLAALAPAAAVFHLVTHAFFKALLFLSCGVVMHAMAGELDMRKMSGLRHKLPWTNVCMLMGCLALAGVPLWAGFFSKDEIVAAAWDYSKILGVIMLAAAFLTAYYTFRLYFRVFQGPEVLPEALADHGAHDSHDAHDAHHSHEPVLMMAPLVVLMLGAIFAGYINWPWQAGFGDFVGQSPSLRDSYTIRESRGRADSWWNNPDSDDSAVQRRADGFGQEVAGINGATLEKPRFSMLMGISAIVALSGLLLAYGLHLKDRAAAQRLADRHPRLVRMLDAKYWVDEFYQAAIVMPLWHLGEICYGVDRLLLDGLIAVVAFVPQGGGWAVKLTTQRGYLQGYAVTMLLGLIVVLMVIFL